MDANKVLNHAINLLEDSRGKDEVTTNLAMATVAGYLLQHAAGITPTNLKMSYDAARAERLREVIHE